MFLGPYQIQRLKKEKLSVVQRHVLNCLLAKWSSVLLFFFLYFLWLKTGWIYLAIIAFFFLICFLGLAIHLGFGPMKKVLTSLKNHNQ